MNTVLSRIYASMYSAQALDSPDSRKTHARAQFGFCFVAGMEKVNIVAYSCWDIHSSVYQWYRCHYPQFISIYIDYSFQHVWTFFFIPVAPISRFQVLSEKWINMVYSCLFTSIMFRCSGTAITWGSQWSQAMSWHSHGSHEYHEVYGFGGGFKAESRGKAPKKKPSTVVHRDPPVVDDAKVVPPVVPEMHGMKAPFGSFPSSIRCLCTYIIIYIVIYIHIHIYYYIPYYTIYIYVIYIYLIYICI